MRHPAHDEIEEARPVLGRDVPEVALVDVPQHPLHGLARGRPSAVYCVLAYNASLWGVLRVESIFGGL